MISEKEKKEKKSRTQCDLITVDLFRLSLGITNTITQVRNMRERRGGELGEGGGEGSRVGDSRL